jgi:diguanylate cyclase (GGDEF)-like protein
VPVAFGSKKRTSGYGEAELLRGLVNLASEVQSSPELDGIVRAIATTVTQTFGYREATVYVVDDDGETFRAQATVGEHPDYDADIFARPVPRRLWDELFLERYQMGSSFFVDHHTHHWTDEQLYYFPPLPLGKRAEGEWHEDDDLFVPMYDKRRRLMGVLDLYDPADRSVPSLEQVKALEVFAAHAAVAVENARQYEELESTSSELQRQLQLRHELLNLSTALLSTLDESDVFALITSMLKQMVDYDTMDIRLIDEDARELVAIYARDENADEMLGFRSSIDEGVSGWVFRHNEAQLVNDMDHDPRAVFVPGTQDGEPQASIIVPLNVRGTVTGVLSIDRLHGRTFDENELEPAKLFANMAAIAIQNARSYEDMERQAISDGLTGIHNYRHFRDTLKATVSRAERYDETFCLLMMDLDHFKTVNDTIGHQAGDEVLRAVADVLRSCSRESDYQARYGGEEFVMLLPQTGLSEASTLAERVRAQVAEIDAGPGLRVTMSIGVASFPDSAGDSDGVLAAADAALLRAKARGRDRVCLAGEDTTRVAATMESELVDLGRRFAEALGLSEVETAGLVTALAVHEVDAALTDEVQTILGSGNGHTGRGNGAASATHDVRRQAVEALLYGSERWDGAGYPEGRRGSAIPRVARAFAVCREYLQAGLDPRGVEQLRAAAARTLDPRMVQRFVGMLRASDDEVESPAA